MQLPLLALILASALTSHAHPFSLTERANHTALEYNNKARPVQRCGIGPPSTGLRQAHMALHIANKLEKLQPRKAVAANSNMVVDAYFHFVTTKARSKTLTPAKVAGMISAQTSVLSSAYASAGISFIFHSYSYTVNDDWATDATDSAMKTALRKGSYAALNVYFQTDLSSGIATPGAQASQLLGYCTLPQAVTYTPSACPAAKKLASGKCAPVPYAPTTYALDGCNILAESMPNGGVVGYEQGKTCVHEVGHWFGLLHTFQDNSCETGDPGDYVDDTPQEAISTDGCPTKAGVTKNSCPTQPGNDPVNNYMDYSSDAW